jgi:hypothetical protein
VDTFDDEPTTERTRVLVSSDHQEPVQPDSTSVDVADVIAKLEQEMFDPDERQSETDRMYSIGWNDRAVSLRLWLQQLAGQL